MSIYLLNTIVGLGDERRAKARSAAATVVPPDTTCLRIIELHLERLPVLCEKERELFFTVTSMLVSPPMIVGPS